MADKTLSSWRALPLWLKMWFALGTLKLQPSRELIARIELWLHVCSYPLLVFGLVNEPALAGGVIMLTHAYVCTLLKWQGDKYAVWPAAPSAAGA